MRIRGQDNDERIKETGKMHFLTSLPCSELAAPRFLLNVGSTYLPHYTLSPPTMTATLFFQMITTQQRQLHACGNLGAILDYVISNSWWLKQYWSRQFSTFLCWSPFANSRGMCSGPDKARYFHIFKFRESYLTWKLVGHTIRIFLLL